MTNLDILNKISRPDNKWFEEAKQRQRIRKKWGCLWKYRVKLIVKYFRLKRWLKKPYVK